jgi:hypothetical protein
MWLTTLHNCPLGSRVLRPRARQRRRVPLLLEGLEDRSLPSAYTAASVSELIGDIRASNKHGGSNTITLAANTTFVLTAADNNTDGATGLPVIRAGTNLTILGNGDTIERSSASGTAAFRLLDVASGGSLTLEDLTLQNGLALGAGPEAEGGAIYNQGTLVLDDVTVQDNLAQGSDGKRSTSKRGAGGAGQDAAGGGIWSNGTLTLANGTTVQSNWAIGGNGGSALYGFPGPGGNAFGGGVYVAGGTATLTSVTLSASTAWGGYGGGSAFREGYMGAAGGGGLYVAGGTVSLSIDIVADNTAASYFSSGGGLSIAAGALVYLDAFTLAHTTNNTADVNPDLSGSYTLL